MDCCKFPKLGSASMVSDTRASLDLWVLLGFGLRVPRLY